MKILKLYAFIIASLLLLDAALPHSAARAWFPRGSGVSVNIQAGAYACGTSYNNWCVGTDGWTRFSTVRNASGTCAAGTATANCFVSVDNSTYASFNGTITGTNTLTINSGAPPLNGQSLLLNGAVIGRITAGTGSGPFTLAGAPANQTSNFTSSPGNDTTCRLEDPPSSTFTGSISGNVLTVASGLTGTVSVGSVVAGTNLIANTVILAYGSGGTTGVGGTGTYQLSASQTGATPSGTTFGSLQLSSYSPALPCFSQVTAFGKLRLTNPKTWNASFTGSLSNISAPGTATLTVTGVSGNPLYVGAALGGGTLTSQTFTGQMSGTAVLTISSGGFPDNGETIYRASGTILGTVISGGGTSTPTLSASTTFGPEASMTSSPVSVVIQQLTGAQGSDGTYSVFTNETGSATTSFGSLSKITATRDWFLVKKGTVWTNDAIGTTASGNWNASGWSQTDLSVITTYGTGARPNFITPDQAQQDCWHSQGGRGYATAIVGFWCSNSIQDPTSARYGTYTVAADAGATLCAGATVICNTTVPAAVQANPTRYRASATGITTIAVSSATATTITLASSVGNATTVGTGQMNVQLTNTTVGAGIGTNEFDTWIVEDNRIDYGAIGPQNTSNIATDIPFARIRRNIVLNQYTANGFGGDNIFTGDTQLAGSFTIEENAFVAGGWIPATWGAYADSHSHNMYIHNPSAPVNLYSNFVGFNSADNQYRDSGTAYNNMFAYNSSGGSLSSAVQDNQAVVNYNVSLNPNNIPVATRTAQVTACGGAGTGCTTLKLDGAISQAVGGNNVIANLTNPNSLGNGTGCNISSVADAVTVNLSCTIANGNRGTGPTRAGVQAGDILRIYQNGGAGIQFNALGQYISNQPGLGTSNFFPYAAMSNVSVTAASPSVVTDTAYRSAGEPFSFSPVIITAFGSGYGASVTGTMTWAGAGCSVNPVLNVSTDASGRIAKFNSITTAGTCATPPAYNGNAWTPGGGLSVGTNATFMYHLNDGTLPTGVSYANNTGSCTGTVVTNPTTNVGVCTYYALANGTSYQFAANSGGTPIVASGSNGSSIQRTGSALFNFDTAVLPIYKAGVPVGVSAGMDAYIDSGAVGFPGASGKTLVRSLSGDRFTLITEDPLITAINGRDQFTMLFGIPTPCSVYPSCYTATLGPNNLFLHSETINNSYGFAMGFNRATSGYVAVGNYISNWNPTVANNTVDTGLTGTNTMNSGGVCASSACVLNQWNDSVKAFPKASVEYYNASQQEAGNTFSGYIDNGAGSAGYILAITSGTPSLAVPTNINYGIGDTVFDSTAPANVVAQYTRVTAQIDATHYLVSVSQLSGSSGSPVSMMYGSTDRFIKKMATQSKETGWVYANTVAAANDYIRAQLQCGNQTTFPGSPACPSQGQTIH